MKGEEILKYLPEEMEAAIKKASPKWEKAEEIRFRVGKPLLFYMDNREYILMKDGRLIEENKEKSSRPYLTQAGEIRVILDRISKHSLYACQEEIRQGYFTLEGGHRAGFAGKVVVENRNVKTMKYISFCNIRIAHEKKGCAKEILPRILKKGRLCHTLIVSPPGCGKTTLLRDMIRMISDGFSYRDEDMGKMTYFPGITVGVADERSEIGAAVRGVPTNDLGMRTDLLDGVPKAEGIFMLLRSMAPRVIGVDEIGSQEDFFAVRQAKNSGCVILATAHGNSREEIEKKPLFGTFLEEQIFDRYVVLSARKGKGTVEKIWENEKHTG